MDYDHLLKLYLCTAVVAMLIAVVKCDWMLVIAEVMAILVGWYPVVKHGARYHAGFLRIGIMTSAVLAILSLVIMSGALSGFLWGPVQWVVILQLLVLSILTFNIGVMFSIILDAYTDSEISRRWMLVLAMVFTFAFSAFYAFMTGYAIWAAGMPFTNEEIAIYGRVTHPILMADPGCASIAGIMCAVVGRKIIKHVPKEQLLVEGT